MRSKKLTTKKPKMEQKPKTIRKKYRHYLNSFRQQSRAKQLTVAIFILLFAGIGSYFLVFSEAASITYTVPASIVPGCTESSADTSAAFRNWLATIPDGSSPTSPNIVQFGANACYRLDGPIFFPTRNFNNVIFEGNGATLKRFRSDLAAQQPHPYSHYLKGYPFLKLSGNNLTVRNMHVRGTNTVSDIDPTTIPGNYLFEPEKFGGHWTAGGFNAEFETGFTVTRSNGLTLENLTTDGTWGDGVLLGSEHPDSLVTNAVVKNVTIDRNGRQGLTIGTVDGAVVDNVKIMHSHASGIDIEVNGTGYTKNVEFKNMYLNSKMVALAAGGLAEASDIYIHDSTIRGAVSSWAWLTEGNHPNATIRRKNWRAHRNTMIMPIQSPAFSFGMTENIEVIDNVMAVSSSLNVNSTNKFPGVKLRDVRGVVTIKNNDFTSNGTTNGALYALNSGVYSADSLTTATVTACGNRTTPTTYNQPAACPTSTGDTTPPTTSITSHPNGATVAGVANLTATATDNTAVTKVEFYVDGALKGSDADNTAPYTYAWDTKTTTNGSHTLMSKAYDAAGNIGTSPTTTVTVNNPTADTQPPTAPANLTATSISSTQINLAWTASTDNVGVTGYDIYRNGAKIATVTTTSYGNTGLAASTSYSYHVIARDATTNSSPQSNTATATTKAPPPPPSATSTLSGTVRSNTGSLLAGAKVSLTVNGSKRTLVTNSVGQYAATGLPAGTYQVKYSAQQHVAQALGVSLASGSINTKDVILVKR
jgi:chitodextrinase